MGLVDTHRTEQNICGPRAGHFVEAKKQAQSAQKRPRGHFKKSSEEVLEI